MSADWTYVGRCKTAADRELQDLHASFVDLEWQQRHRLAAGLQSDASSQWARLDSTANAEILRRNRYFNVEPFASNRVRLRVPDGQLDYINASPIVLTQTVSGTEKRYIATQGPKEDSRSHIWRMVYAETGRPADPAVIVMLTQTHESGKEKCFQYFPADLSHASLEVNEQDEFADGFHATLTLQELHEDDETRSTIRTMDLSVTEPESTSSSAGPEHTPATPQTQHKTVHHLLFGGWPDFLVPEGPDRAALIQLVAKSAALNDPASNSRIVHCSAGVGRSGTFIALDYLLTEIAEGAWDDVAQFTQVSETGDAAADGVTGAAAEREASPLRAGNRDSLGAAKARDPILDVVDKLRKQRMMMVQGEGQFLLLYDICREVWLERWRTLHAGPSR